MTKRHLYLGIENLNLNATQRGQLMAALRALGPTNDPQPARLNHWRTRLDGEAAIFEALFNENALMVDAFKTRLANIFSVNLATIDHATSSHSFADGNTPIVVFSRSGVDYLRFALFGGINAAWMESGDECRGYLAANRDEWEPEL